MKVVAVVMLVFAADSADVVVVGLAYLAGSVAALGAAPVETDFGIVKHHSAYSHYYYCYCHHFAFAVEKPHFSN